MAVRDAWVAGAQEVLRRVEMFHADSVVCGLSALAHRTNAPTILRQEALVGRRRGCAATGRSRVAACAQSYPSAHGATVFGSKDRVAVEKVPRAALGL